MGTTIFTLSTGLLDLLNDAVCAVDAGGRFVYVSAACEQIFGYTAAEMVGTLMIDMVAPEDRARTMAAAADVMAGAAQPNFENRYLRKNGERVDIMWSARWSEADQLRIAVARDVTARKHGEAMRTAMYAISEATQAAKDQLSLFTLVHRIVDDLLPAPGFSIALYDEQRGELHYPYNVDAQGQPSTANLPAIGSLCGHVIRASRPLLLTTATLSALPAELPAAAAGAAPNWLGVPLSAPGGALGVLAVNGSPERSYTAQDQELLEFVATQVATAMERMHLHEQLRYMAQYDALTRLPNRQLFHDRLDSALARAGRSGVGFSLLYLDIDRFKQVNDLHGHAAGDLLLHEVAERIRQSVREVDTVARLGGDEFVVLLENMALASDAARVAEKIEDALARPVTFGTLSLQAAISIGIATYPEHGNTGAQLLKQADSAMYLAKKSRADVAQHHIAQI
jgi:diguanylate cyclase (GGDEF)-like protein/PAS domain S-box-containing protein